MSDRGTREICRENSEDCAREQQNVLLISLESVSSLVQVLVRKQKLDSRPYHSCWLASTLGWAAMIGQIMEHEKFTNGEGGNEPLLNVNVPYNYTLPAR